MLGSRVDLFVCSLVSLPHHTRYLTSFETPNNNVMFKVFFSPQPLLQFNFNTLTQEGFFLCKSPSFKRCSSLKFILFLGHPGLDNLIGTVF